MNKLEIKKNVVRFIVFYFFNNNTCFNLLTKTVKMSVKHIKSKKLSRFVALFANNKTEQFN